MQNKELLSKIPSFVLWTSNILINANYDSYLVGGCVRDLLLNRKPKDWDIATNALPEKVIQLFPKAITTHAKFGTVIVLAPDEYGENNTLEVTTYRQEAEYIGGRWPSHIEFGKSLSQDLKRRDFTINAMALSLKIADHWLESKPLEQNKSLIVDLFDGQNDLQKKIIRAVGNPMERLQEDGLRGYRACRLASVLGFEIEKATFDAISQTLDIAKQVSLERVRDEWVKLLLHSPKPSYGIELLRQSGLLHLFLAELEEGINVFQPQYHVDDVYTHSIKALNAASDRVKIAAILHDIGKPRTRSEDQNGVHFYDHAQVGAKMAKQILTRLKFSNSQIQRVVHLINHHMFYYEEKWTDAAVRRFIKRVGEEYIDDLFALRIADSISNAKSEFNPKDIQKLEARISKLRQQAMAIKITDLAINGNDLKKIGIKQGPSMGKILESLLNIVIDDPASNTPKDLLKLAKQFQKTKP